MWASWVRPSSDRVARRDSVLPIGSLRDWTILARSRKSSISRSVHTVSPPALAVQAVAARQIPTLSVWSIASSPLFIAHRWASGNARRVERRRRRGLAGRRLLRIDLNADRGLGCRTGARSALAPAKCLMPLRGRATSKNRCGSPDPCGRSFKNSPVLSDGKPKLLRDLAIATMGARASRAQTFEATSSGFRAPAVLRKEGLGGNSAAGLHRRRPAGCMV